MEVVRALYDGHNICPMEPIRTKRQTEVLIIFPNNSDDVTPSEARRLLRGSGKGEMLTDKLLQSRAEDIRYERES